MIKFEVKSRWTGIVQFVADIECDENTPHSMKRRLAVEWARESDAYLRGVDLSYTDLRGVDLSDANLSDANLYGVNLSDANLRGVDLSYANLRGVNLRGVDLSDAYLRGVNLSDANLSDANLYGVDLSYADLRGVNLSYANLSDAYLRRVNLRGVNLSYANLSDADLRGVDLSYANLRGVNLSDANLSDAYLRGVNLSDAENAELVIARSRILPDGDIIGWKKCRGGVIVKLRIPEAAKRSHAFGRKCRAEYVDVLEVIGGYTAISMHDGKTEYVAGQRVAPDKFDENWHDECSGGIHFYITRLEAEEHR